jgi:hypothetical protein
MLGHCVEQAVVRFVRVRLSHESFGLGGHQGVGGDGGSSTVGFFPFFFSVNV